MPIRGNEDQYFWEFEIPSGADSLPVSSEFPWLTSKEKLRNTRSLKDDSLCRYCKTLDFKYLFESVLGESIFKFNEKELRLTHGIRLGSLKEIKRRERCSFCSLVWRCYSRSGSEKSVPDTQLSLDFWLDNFATSNEGRINLKSHRQRNGPAVVHLEISIREWKFLNKGVPRLGESLAEFRIQQQPTVDLIGGATLSSGTGNLDFWRLLKWVDCCQESPQLPAFLIDLHERLELYSRVIDTHRRRIVYAPKGCRYVALSYVWGGKNFSRLTTKNLEYFEQDGSIDEERFPRTIYDAVLLCRELGERYLWVDSMCIIQDTEDKHNHMKSMEAIYRGAVLTVVAAVGNNADAGLPGFSRKLFSFRERPASVQGLNLVGMAPDFEKSVDLSIWNTRAWTYQERLLSRRMLIFTKDQVYFNCSHGRAQGDGSLNPHEPDYVQYLTTNAEWNSNTYGLEMRRKVNFNTYAKVVQEYTNRVLSYEYDIENAFGGIKKILVMLFNGSEVLFGVPLSILAIALLWDSKGALKPRPETTSKGKTISTLKPFSVLGGFIAKPRPKDPKNELADESTIGDSSMDNLKVDTDDDSRFFQIQPQNDSGDDSDDEPLYTPGTRTSTKPGGLSAQMKRFAKRFSGNEATSTTDKALKQGLRSDPLAPQPLPFVDGPIRQQIEPASHEEEHIFPSWSWVGWNGPVEFSEIKNISERTISLVTWLDPLNKLKKLPQDNFSPPPAGWSGRNNWLRQVSVDGQIYYTQRGGDGRHWFCHPMEPFIHNPIPIDRETGTLYLGASVAEFKVEPSKQNSSERARCFLLDQQGVRAGKITLDAGNSSLSSKLTLIQLSQTTLREGEGDPAWDPARAVYLGRPGERTRRISGVDVSGAEELFDTATYDPRICWCLYNVLVVKMEGQKANRIGIGKIHIWAFDAFAKPDQLIELN